MNSPTARICVCLILSILLLSSCDKKPLTSGQYVSQANAICASAAAKAESPPALTTPAQVEAFVRQTEDIYRGLLARLRQLKPPDSLHARVDQMLNQLQLVATYLPQLQKAVSANDQGKTSDLVAKIEQASTTASQLATELGLERCVNAGNVAGPSSSPSPSPSE